MTEEFDVGFKRGGYARGTIWAKPKQQSEISLQDELQHLEDTAQDVSSLVTRTPASSLLSTALGSSIQQLPTVTVTDVEMPASVASIDSNSNPRDDDTNCQKRSVLPSLKNISLAAQLTASVSVKVAKSQSIQELVDTVTEATKFFKPFRKSVLFEVTSSLGNMNGFDEALQGGPTNPNDDVENVKPKQHSSNLKLSLADELNAFLGNEGICVRESVSKSVLFKSAFSNVICVAPVPDEKKSFCVIVASDYHRDIPGLGFDDDECLLSVAHIFKIDAAVKKLDVRDVVLAINSHIRRSSRNPRSNLLKGDSDDKDAVSIAGDDAAVSAFRRSIRRASRRSTKSKSSEVLQAGEDDVSVYGFDASDSEDSDDYDAMGFGTDAESLRSYSVRGWSPDGSGDDGDDRAENDVPVSTKVPASYINVQVIRDEQVHVGRKALSPVELAETVKMQDIFDMRPVCNTPVSVNVSPTQVEMYRTADFSGVVAMATPNILKAVTGCSADFPALTRLWASTDRPTTADANAIGLLGIIELTANERAVVHVCMVETAAAAEQLCRCIGKVSTVAREAVASNPTIAARYQQSSVTMARRRLPAPSDVDNADSTNANTDARLAQLDRAGRIASLQLFNAVLVGSVTVGDTLAVDKIAGHAVKKSSRVKDQSPVVVLIADDHIHVMDVVTSENVLTHDFRKLQRVTVDERKGDHFVVEDIDKVTGLTMAHVYKCVDETAAETAAETLQTAHRDALARLPVNPFSAVGRSDHPIPKRLAKYHISRHCLTSKKVIGAGQFGQVLLSDREGDIVTECAVKLLRPTATAAERENFFQECKTMAVLADHPNVCQMMGFDLKEQPWLLVLEHVCYGDLRNLLVQCRDKAVELKEAEQLGFAMQIANGLAFIASKGYIHLDIAARNILVGPQNLCKVADFGLAQNGGSSGLVILEEKLKLPVRWLAPEAITTRKFSEYSDCWAYGVTVWEILTYGNIPFENLPSDVIQDGVCDDMRLPQPVACSNPVYDTLLLCWQDDRKLRPRFEQLSKIFTALFVRACAADMYVRDIGAACTLLQLRTMAVSSLSWAQDVVHDHRNNTADDQHNLQQLQHSSVVQASISDDCYDFDHVDKPASIPAGVATTNTSVNHAHVYAAAPSSDFDSRSAHSQQSNSSSQQERSKKSADDVDDSSSDEYVDVTSALADVVARNERPRRGSEASLVLHGTNTEQDVTIDDAAHGGGTFVAKHATLVQKATARRKPAAAHAVSNADASVAATGVATAPSPDPTAEPQEEGVAPWEEGVTVASSERSSLSPPPTHEVVQLTSTRDRTSVMKVILPQPSPSNTLNVDQVYDKDSARSSERRRAFWAQGLDAGSGTSSPSPASSVASLATSPDASDTSTRGRNTSTSKRSRGGCCLVQ
eukprot:m.1167510 g.1167510  ORF g.1167510 m.1167510 type:complete len:1398 (-) comp24507_c0_seq2:220-4413(-)